MQLKSFATLILLMMTFVCAGAEIFRSCKTPDNLNGICIPIRNCSTLLELVMMKPLPHQTRIFLLNSKCKTDRQPWVCCPKNESSQVGEVTAKEVNVTLSKPPDCGRFTEYRIFRGDELSIDEYPSLALLLYSKPGNETGIHCEGSIINNRYVITAASCIKKIPASWRLTGVRLGDFNKSDSSNPDCETLLDGGPDLYCNDPYVDIAVEEAIVHENYDSKNQHNDISLLRLANNITYSEFIQPICLHLDEELRNTEFSRRRPSLVGWGSSSDTKRKMDVNVVPDVNCQSFYKNSAVGINDDQICAGRSEETNSCQNFKRGDPGGPLIVGNINNNMFAHYLLGIMSFGLSDCSTITSPDVFTRVSNYVSWISANVRR